MCPLFRCARYVDPKAKLDFFVIYNIFIQKFRCMWAICKISIIYRYWLHEKMLSLLLVSALMSFSGSKKYRWMYFDHFIGVKRAGGGGSTVYVKDFGEKMRIWFSLLTSFFTISLKKWNRIFFSFFGTWLLGFVCQLQKAAHIVKSVW